MLKRVKIDTADLEFGMYVSELDRPWLETPFLFQGFVVEDPDDLEQLRSNCNHVYVDVTRGSVPEEKVREIQKRHAKVDDGDAAPPRQSEPQGSLLDAISSLDRTGVLAARVRAKPYENVVSTREEAGRATLAYDSATTVMNDLLAQLRAGKALNAEKLQVAISPMIDSVMRNQDAMAWLVQLRKRDTYSYNHSLASSVWAVILGRHLGFDRVGLDTLAMGGLLLDLGKAQIPREILTREGPLTDAEHAIVRRHVSIGMSLVKKTPGVNADAIAMIAGHHERHDGSGYPDGLAGADIPVYGRIAGLIDTFDAMTTKRPYAPAKSAYDAIRELNGLSGNAFQRELVEQFVQALGMFPSGSLVELNTGEIAIVIEQNRVRRLRPKLMLLLDADKAPVASHETIDLRTLPASPGDPGARWIERGLEPGAHGLDPKDFFA